MERRDNQPLGSPLRPGANRRPHPSAQRGGRLVRDVPKRALHRRTHRRRSICELSDWRPPACSSAEAFRKSFGGVARMVLIRVSRATFVAAQNKKSECNVVLMTNMKSAGGFNCARPGAKAIGKRRT